MATLLSKLDSKFFTLALTASLFAVASADEVHVSGLTHGRFNAQAFADSNSILGLTFDRSTFDNTTVGGTLDLGGNPTPGTNFNNLGSFSLNLSDAAYNGNTFQLQVTFTTPSTIAGGATTTFNDFISGTVTGGIGGVFVDFDNTPQTFNFSNSTTKGSFTMFVNDVSVAPGQAASLTGHLTGRQEAVPEPTVIAGVVCGLIGLARRRKA